jgi:hypothetical protein
MSTRDTLLTVLRPARNHGRNPARTARRGTGPRAFRPMTA